MVHWCYRPCRLGRPRHFASERGNGIMPSVLTSTRGVQVRARPSRTAGAARAKVMVRLFMPINDIVRQRSLYRGQMSEAIADAVRRTDLNSTPLIEAAATRGKMLSPTTISLDVGVLKRLRSAARHRGCSMNSLMNSALAEHFRRNNVVL